MRYGGIFVAIAVLASPYTAGGEVTDANAAPALTKLEFRAAAFDLYRQRYLSSLLQLLETEQSPDTVFGKGGDQTFPAGDLSGIGPLPMADRLSGSSLPSKDEADAVLADLYLALGLPKPAEELLRRLDGKHTAAAKRGWLSLARLYYRHGYLTEAEQALARLRGLPEGALQAERDSLSALVLLARQRDKEAITVLRKGAGQAQRPAVADYNLGLALLDKGDLQEGAAAMGRLDGAAKASPDTAALRDLADINLGYALLGQQQWQQAGAILQKAVHSKSYSAYALLGSGWADFLKGDRRKALESWLPLLQRDPGDPAVQEGLLTVPYAYYRLQDYGQALDYYRQAADGYTRLLTRIQNARGALSDGSFLNALVTSHTGGEEFDAQWQPRTLPASSAVSSLLPILASHRFQEGLKNYRDLRIARDALRTAGSDIDASLDLLAKQREIHERWKRQTQQHDRDVSPAALARRIKQLRDELARAEATHDVMALATVEQKQSLFDLKEAKKLLDIVKNYIVDYDELYDQYRLLTGLMIWDLTQQYPARLEEVKQQLQGLENTLNEAMHDKQSLARSSQEVEATLSKQESAYRALRAKEASLAKLVPSLLAEQRKYLEAQLLRGSQDAEKRVTHYLSQARLGIAQASDQLAAASAKKDYDQTIAAYQAFLQQDGDSPYRRDVMLRVAYLKMLQADNRDNDPAAAQGKGNRGDALYGEAIALLMQALKEYPKDPDNDRVLYNLAKAYDRRGEIDKVLDSLDRLAKDYPRSAHIEEVQFRRGELLFSLGLPAQAAEAYDAIVTHRPDSPYYEKALYKLAWSHFKEGRYDAAVDAFLPLLQRELSAAVPEAKADAPGLSRGEEELVNDILRGAALSLAQLKGAQSLAAYFARRGEQPYEYRLYGTLARLYLEQERIEDAANVYRSFVARHPNDPQAPSFDARILAVYQKGGFNDLLQTAKQDFIKRYEPAAVYWQNNPGAERGEVLGKVQEYLHEMTRYAHAKAQQSKAEADYRQAEHWYALLLQSFPEDPVAAQMHFLFGDILFEDHRYADAVREYQKVAYDYKDAEKGAEAGYAAALAQEKVAENLSGDAKQAAVQQSLVALQRFAENYPGDARAPAALMKAAQEWFTRHDRPQSTAAAQRLLNMKPQVDKTLQRNAWTILGHNEFAEQRYVDAEHSYQQVLSLMTKDDDKRRGMEENLAAAVYKQGEQARAGGDLRVAVGHFLRIADLTPDVDIVPTAQYDAAAALLALEDWPAAIEVLERFRKRYPDNPLQKQLAPKLAVAYQKVKDWPKAAAELEVIAKQGESEELRRDAVWQSAELYVRAAQPQQAQRMFQEYLKRFPKPVKEAIEAQQRLVDLYAQQNDTKQQHHWLREIIATDKRAGAERSDRTRLLAGRAALILADIDYQSFAKIKLTRPLKRSLKRKKKAMEKALAAYRDVGKYGIAEITTAATYRAAQIYSELGKSIMASQRPKGLSALELEQYDVLLEEQAYPFEEKAIALHEANAQRVTDNVYDDWVKKSFAALSKLLPGRYAKTEMGETYVDAIY